MLNTVEIRIIIKVSNAPKRARIWLQYTTPPGPHIAPFTKNDDAALLRIPAPTIQNNQVTNIQMAWAPMDAIGCLDQAEWRKTTEYALAVREVQHDANLISRSMWMKEEMGQKERSLAEVIGH